MSVKIEESAAAALTRENIRRGIAWLSKHASSGWEFRLLAFGENGQAYSTAHDSYTDECALARAFGERTDMPMEGNRVTFAGVKAAFGMSQKDVEERGFVNTSSLGIPWEIFDKIWEHELFKHLATRSTEQPEHVPPAV